MKTLLFSVLLLLATAINANVGVYFNYAIFSTSSANPYLETYLTITGKSVRYNPYEKGYQANVNISWKIFKDTVLVKQSQYNLFSPVANDTLSKPSFIDNQRFSLPNGKYKLELVIIDNNSLNSKTSHTENFTIDISRDKKIAMSDIQILESFTKSATKSSISKNGYDLIPYNVNYFPDHLNSLKFYVESYNADTALGKKSKFLYTYFIENSENFYRQKQFTGFQKQESHKVNPLLVQMDISKLPSGNYNLVVLIKDSANKNEAIKKWYFQRQNSSKNSFALANSNNISTVDEFFNSFNSVDSLKQFVECLYPISGSKEREWQQTQCSKKDPSLMRSYLIDYWKTQAADTADAFVLWSKYYKDVLETNAMLKCGKQKGYYTDRGRVYLQYGKPDARNQVNSEANTYPYEIWQYYRIYDKATGRFFTNKKFIFANFAIADDCYTLIHSDVKGELYNEKWRFRLVQRSQQTINVDATNPTKTYGSNMDANFDNPR